MRRTIFHIEDQPEPVQDAVYAFIAEAASVGIQLTHLDFTVEDTGALAIDGMLPGEWIDGVGRG